MAPTTVIGTVRPRVGGWLRRKPLLQGDFFERAKLFPPRATPTQVALAWLIARPSITAPIANATSLAQLDEIIGGARLKLDADTIKRLNEASA